MTLLCEGEEGQKIRVYFARIVGLIFPFTHSSILQAKNEVNFAQIVGLIFPFAPSSVLHLLGTLLSCPEKWSPPTTWNITPSTTMVPVTPTHCRWDSDDKLREIRMMN